MEYLVRWFYEAGFSNGEKTESFKTLEEAKAYLEKNKDKMIMPSLYERIDH